MEIGNVVRFHKVSNSISDHLGVVVDEPSDRTWKVYDPKAKKLYIVFKEDVHLTSEKIILDNLFDA